MSYYDRDTLEPVVTEAVKPAAPALPAAATASLIGTAICG
jgi:hypothetical protein